MRWIKTIGITGLSLLILWVGAPVVRAQTGSSWTGEYFNNPSLSGAPVLVRTDQAVNFIWGATAPAPGLPADRFSVRWTRTAYFEGGAYRFIARSDDGMRVYLDNVVIMDSWVDRAPDPPVIVEINIPTGQHIVRVEYYENGGTAMASLGWIPLGSAGTTQWIAQYYNNLTLAGGPVIERIEQTIDYDWGFGSPAPGQLSSDGFSARWTGSPYFTAGSYAFTIYADDGVRLWVDNQLIIDQWRGSGLTPAYTAVVTLNEGQHAVRIDYFEQIEVAAIRIEWALVNMPVPTAIPPTPVPSGSPVTGSWQAEYYNNPTLGGSPSHSEAMAAPGLDLDWGTGTPASTVPSDNFSARFTRQVTFTESNVRFVLRADDGVRLYLDGVPVLDEWHTASGSYYFADRIITPGDHTLTLEFYESSIRASLRFYWLYPRPVSAGTGAAAQVNAYLLNVRSGPGTAYPVLGRARHNETFTVTGRSTSDPRWVRINYGMMEGWINGTWTTLQGSSTAIPQVPIEAEAVPLTFGIPTGLRARATTNLNIRSGPGTSYPVIGWLAAGVDVAVVGRNSTSSWWEINFSHGRGWISAGYVQLEGTLGAAVPVTG